VREWAPEPRSGVRTWPWAEAHGTGMPNSEEQPRRGETSIAGQFRPFGARGIGLGRVYRGLTPPARECRRCAADGRDEG
jgi:hypothetical protein